MIGSNSSVSPDAADLTDSEAARLAHQIASDRFLPISARHYEAYLARIARFPLTAGPYDRSDLMHVPEALLKEAVTEIELFRDGQLMKRFQAAARNDLNNRYRTPAVAQPAQAAGQQQRPSSRI